MEKDEIKATISRELGGEMDKNIRDGGNCRGRLGWEADTTTNRIYGETRIRTSVFSGGGGGHW